MNMIREKTHTHNIELVEALEKLPDRVTADERKLKQIMYNLLSNAVKYTPDQGTIRLSAAVNEPVDSGAPQAILVSVADTRCGIERADIERIFETFEQGHNAERSSVRGTGLGLPLTRKLIELHGGSVWAESDGPGKGAVLRFALPLRVSLHA